MFNLLMRGFPAVLILLIYIPLSAAGSGTEYGIPELVGRALERSDLLNASRKSVESAGWMKGQAGAWQNPSVSFSAGNKSASGKTGLSYDAGVTQPFYFPGKQGLAEEIAGLKERMAGLSYDETRLLVRYSVIRLAYRYAAALELSKHTDERVKRFKAIRAYLASRPFLSPKKRIEKHIVEMKLVLLERDLAETVSATGTAWAMLNLFIDMPGRVALRSPWIKTGVHVEWQSLYDSAVSGNIDLKKQLLLLDMTEKETGLARMAVLPDFSLSLLYREDRVPDVERFAGAGVSLSIPLWNRNSAGVRSLEASVEMEKFRLAHARRETVQVLSVAFTGYENARMNLERMPVSLLDDVHSRMRDADISFDRGLIDLVTYSEVENQAYDIHTAVLAAQYDYIEKYTGLLIIRGSEDFAPAGSAGKDK